MRLVILGPPGVGKGTQAVRIVERLGLCHLSTGEALRDAIRSDGANAKDLKACLDAGQLVPDELDTALADFIGQGANHPKVMADENVG